MADELQACQDPGKEVDKFLNELLKNKDRWANMDPATKEELEGFLCQ